MSKGSKQRPTDHYIFEQNYDKIFRTPKDAVQHKDCGFPFCDCKERCEKYEKNRLCFRSDNEC